MKTRVPMDVKVPEKLQNGEKVVCEVCGEGIYKPVIPDTKNCYCFICDNCGVKVNIN